MDARRETKKKKRHRGINGNSTRDDSTTVGRYGPSGRLWVNASSTLETNRNGVRAFRSRFRVPVDPASASLQPLRGRRGAKFIPSIRGRGRRDRCLTSPSRTSSPQPPLAIYRYSGSPLPPSNPAKYSCQRTRSLRRRYVFGVSRILMWLRPKYKLFLIISVYRKIPCILSMRPTLIDMYFTATLERDISRWALVMREIVITYVSSQVMYVQ